MGKKDVTNLYEKTVYLYDLDPRPLVKDDIPFYLEYASKVKGNILELACGSGRVTIPLAKAGYEVWGVDLSETMLGRLRAKIKNLPIEVAKKIHPLYSDMINFKIANQFPLVIIPFRSFQSLTDEIQQNKCLQNIYNHLSGNGHFIITFFKPFENIESAWIKKEEIFDWENIDPQTGRRVRRNHIKKDIKPDKQIIYVEQVYYIEKEDGAEERLVEEVCIKYDYENKIRSLLNLSGFKIITEMGYYDGRPITEGSEFIFICQKK
jgi:SAM-dependent methyltransferase